MRLAEADDCLWWCFCGDSCTLSWLKEACGSRQSLGRSDGQYCHVNAVDDRQVSRAAGDCASPACQASWVSSVRGPWCGTPNSGEGNEDVRPCSNTECAAAALLLCASCTLCSLWVWGTFWTVAACHSVATCCLQKHRCIDFSRAKPQSRKASARSLTNRAVRQVHSVGAWPVVLLRALHSRRAADAARGLQSDGQQRQSTRALHRHVRLSVMHDILLSSCDQTHSMVT